MAGHLSAGEQQTVRTLPSVAHRGYVLDAGRVVASGPGPALLDDPDVRRTHLDLGGKAPP